MAHGVQPYVYHKVNYSCYLMLKLISNDYNIKSNTTLKCILKGNFTLPAWQGPPNFSILSLEKHRILRNPRHSWSENAVDLVINYVQKSDAGDYQCTYTGMGIYRLRLVVTFGK